MTWAQPDRFSTAEMTLIPYKYLKEIRCRNNGLSQDGQRFLTKTAVSYNLKVKILFMFTS